MAKDERLKLVEKIYNIVLAARTEGIVGGKTKRFAEDDTEAILALLEAEIGQERKRIYEWGSMLLAQPPEEHDSDGVPRDLEERADEMERRID